MTLESALRTLALLAGLVLSGAGCVPVYVPSDWQQDPRSQELSLEATLTRKVDLKLPSTCLVVDTRGGAEDRSGSMLVHAVADALDKEGVLLPITTIDAATPSGASSGISGSYAHARELAALHQAPLVLVCREGWSHLEGWTPLRILYGFLVTLLFVPGESVETTGSLDVALVDVRTGIVVAAASRVEVEEAGYVRIGASPAARLENERTIVARAAPLLADRINRGVRARFLEQGGAAKPGPAATRAASALEKKPSETKR